MIVNDREENPHSSVWRPYGGRQIAPAQALLQLLGAVESRPDSAGSVVAVDPPFVGDSPDDVQSVVPRRIDHSLVPGTAIVLDFDPRVVSGLMTARTVKVPPGRRERLCWAALAASSEAHKITSSAREQ
jgi:hypothetical protein